MLLVNGKKRGAELLVGDDCLVCYGLRYDLLPVEAMYDLVCLSAVHALPVCVRSCRVCVGVLWVLRY